MSHVVYPDPSVFLVVTGRAYASDLTHHDDLVGGLTFRQPTPNGDIDLFIAAPCDLAGLADLSAAAILKPVVLPLTLTGLRHGIVETRLRVDAAAQRLAQKILAANAASPQPVPPRR